MTHVIPENDLREHDTSTQCWCRPRVEWQGPNGEHYATAVVIHNSADCREAVERAIGESVDESKKWIVVEE